MGINSVEGATNLGDINSLAARLCDIPTKTQWLKPSTLNISFMSACGRKYAYTNSDSVRLDDRYVIYCRRRGVIENLGI